MVRTTLLGIGLALALTGSAAAGDSCHKSYYKYVTCYETVITWEVREEPYTKCVTKYDHCGRPYTVEVVCYREVRVPVKSVVPVTKKVLVCD